VTGWNGTGTTRIQAPCSRGGGTRAGAPAGRARTCTAGEVRLISLCAGQGRDLIGVLTGHPRRDDVRARLVELDERNVVLARQVAGLPGVEVLQAAGEI
jgi:hypothetical protein